MSDSRPVALVLGPPPTAVSGVATHVQGLLHSPIAARYALVHFPVGSEGRGGESPARRALRLIRDPFRLAFAVARCGACIVHVNVSLNAKGYWRDLAHVIAARLAGARVVLQKHGGELSRFCANPLFARFVRATLRLPDAVVVLSQAELAEYEAFAPGAHVVAVPNGIDPTPYLAFRRSPSLDRSRPLSLLYVGRLVPGKGLDEILEALVLVREAGHAPQLLVAGAGPEAERLAAKARSLGLEGQVRFSGAVIGEEKLRLLCAADVLLLPSYSEGLPYSVLEAMAAGAVPVATAVGAIPEVVVDGIHGRLVPVRDAAAVARALLELDRDRDALARMSAAARQRVAAAYSLERVALDFLRLYQGLAPCPASQAG